MTALSPGRGGLWSLGVKPRFIKPVLALIRDSTLLRAVPAAFILGGACAGRVQRVSGSRGSEITYARRKCSGTRMQNVAGGRGQWRAHARRFFLCACIAQQDSLLFFFHLKLETPFSFYVFLELDAGSYSTFQARHQFTDLEGEKG